MPRPLFATALLITSFCIASNAQTVLTGNMTVARASAVATRLHDGRVLVTGGFGGVYLDSAELFDLQTGTFTRIGDMHSIRTGHTATLLQNGDVLIAGGGYWQHGAQMVSSAELYIAETGTFMPISDMVVARFNHSATLLQDGTVLVAGGFNQSQGIVLADAEVYDPTTRRFTRVGSMTRPRYAHCAALLPDGAVLIVGGLDVADVGSYSISAEIYDPQTRTFEPTVSPRDAHTGETVVLKNGEILFVGTDDPPAISSVSEIYDPVAGTFRLSLPVWNAPWAATATLLPGGAVLIAGGGDESATNDIALFDPATSSYRVVGKLQTYRTEHSAVALRDGRVLLLGGEDDGSAAGVLRSAEIYGVPLTRRRAVVH